MTARKCRSLEPSLLAKDVGNPGDQMVGQRLTGRYIPALDERCPVELHAHHIVDALGNLCETVDRNSIQGMKQLLTDAEAILLQTGYECHDRHGRFRFHVNGLTVDVEEHGTVAQSYVYQSLIVHKVFVTELSQQKERGN